MKGSYSLFFAVVAACFSALLPVPLFIDGAGLFSELFMRMLKLLSLPLLFFSIVSTLCSFDHWHEMRRLGSRTFLYTLGTTVVAASVALGFYLLYNPLGHGALPELLTADRELLSLPSASYWSYLLSIVPANLLDPFVKNNFLGVLFLAGLVSAATFSLPQAEKEWVRSGVQAAFSLTMIVAGWLTRVMPLAIWAFITLFLSSLKQGAPFLAIALYLGCILSANIAQGCLVLPLLLRSKGISPRQFAKAVLPALSFAFFSKSSSATLPIALKSAGSAGLSSSVSRFTLPLCTAINMNGCAAFILITVLFVSSAHGVVHTPVDLVSWVVVATLAAIGNAGIPMGCYFLASALLAAMDLPLYLMGLILPFYSLIDMVETALNVWSDLCVTAAVDSDLSEQAPAIAERA